MTSLCVNQIESIGETGRISVGNRTNRTEQSPECSVVRWFQGAVRCGVVRSCRQEVRFGAPESQVGWVGLGLQVEIIKCGAVRGQFDMFDMA
jgi:hypothetical protein